MDISISTDSLINQWLDVVDLAFYEPITTAVRWWAHNMADTPLLREVLERLSSVLEAIVLVYRTRFSEDSAVAF